MSPAWAALVASVHPHMAVIAAFLVIRGVRVRAKDVVDTNRTSEAMNPMRDVILVLLHYYLLRCVSAVPSTSCVNPWQKRI